MKIEKFTTKSFEEYCYQIGIGFFDLRNETFALMSRFSQYYTTAERMFADMNSLAVTPLAVSMSSDDIVHALSTYIKRPVPMMRYPATFLQDPIYWAIMDFDWYLHCHASLSQINRMRAILAFTKKPLTYPVVTELYDRHLKPFGTPFYGVGKGVASYAMALVAAYSRRKMDLAHVWDLLTNEPAWISTALYRYHQAIKQSTEALKDMIEKSALTKEFWEMVGRRYEVEIARVYDEKDFEILGVTSLFNLTNVIDVEYVAELNAARSWKFANGSAWLSRIPNLYGAEGTQRHWILKAMSDIASYRENRWFADHYYVMKNETEEAKFFREMFDLDDSTYLFFELVSMQNPPVAADYLDISEFFPEHKGFNDDEYKMPPLRGAQIDLARKSIAGGEDTIPFITEEERKKIFLGSY